MYGIDRFVSALEKSVEGFQIIIICITDGYVYLAACWVMPLWSAVI
jgi:hypothetical protein